MRPGSRITPTCSRSDGAECSTGWVSSGSVCGADVADAVRTVVAVLAARRGGATINAAAKKAEINYRTASRIVDAAENGRRVGLSAAS